ncbi:MAG TPA: hypothetical protein VKA85_01680 [Candidatus Limnocylindrales bacterium]|nr:hypothetical protein [Candidatus Limnocylindrales bacterium]
MNRTTMPLVTPATKPTIGMSHSPTGQTWICSALSSIALAAERSVRRAHGR